MTEDRFCQMYHKAMVKAVKDEAEKVKSRIASNWINDWMKELEGPLEEPEEFRKRFQDFLEHDLGFAANSKISLDGDTMRIDVEGCRICEGNELLRAEGIHTFCPIIPTGLFALSRAHKKNAQLIEVEKDGRVGYCSINYRIKEKR